MTTHNVQERYTVQAGADLTGMQFRVITLNGTLYAAASGHAAAAGVNQSSCRSGDYATYIFEGIVKAIAGAAVNSLGAPLKVASGGFLTPCASGDMHIGRAISTAASGDLFQAFVDFKTFPLVGNVAAT